MAAHCFEKEHNASPSFQSALVRFYVFVFNLSSPCYFLHGVAREPVFVARGRFSECKGMWPVQAYHRFFSKLKGTRTNNKTIFFNFEKKLRWHACTGHILLHSENLPQTTKTGSRATSGSRSNTLGTPDLIETYFTKYSRVFYHSFFIVSSFT